MQSTKGPGRPPGEIRQAMWQAAQRGPGTVLELAARAQVGRQAAAYTVSRMVRCGELSVLRQGRPAVLGVAPAPEVEERRARVDQALAELHRSFWNSPSRAADAPLSFDEL